MLKFPVVFVCLWAASVSSLQLTTKSNDTKKTVNRRLAVMTNHLSKNQCNGGIGKKIPLVKTTSEERKRDFDVVKEFSNQKNYFQTLFNAYEKVLEYSGNLAKVIFEEHAPVGETEENTSTHHKALNKFLAVTSKHRPSLHSELSAKNKDVIDDALYVMSNLREVMFDSTQKSNLMKLIDAVLEVRKLVEHMKNEIRVAHAKMEMFEVEGDADETISQTKSDETFSITGSNYHRHNSQFNVIPNLVTPVFQNASATIDGMDFQSQIIESTLVSMFQLIGNKLTNNHVACLTCLPENDPLGKVAFYKEPFTMDDQMKIEMKIFNAQKGEEFQNQAELFCKKFLNNVVVPFFGMVENLPMALISMLEQFEVRQGKIEEVLKIKYGGWSFTEVVNYEEVFDEDFDECD